jgi:hypothetical protein
MGSSHKIILAACLFKFYSQDKLLIQAKPPALIELQCIENSNMLVQSQILLLFTKECA